MHDLESQGIVLRGRFERNGPLEFCDRALLARIHRYTLNRLRAEIEPVSAADFMRFLFAWQHVDPTHRLAGIEGLRAIVARLDGFELPGRAWERAVLPSRVERYEPSMLDMLCLTGYAGWGRLSSAESASIKGANGGPPKGGHYRHLRVALFVREHADAWRALRPDAPESDGVEQHLDAEAHTVLDALRSGGASFLRDIGRRCGISDRRAAEAIASLTVAGLVTSDGFAGVRGVIRALKSERSERSAAGQHDMTGRWSAWTSATLDHDAAIELQARALLERYGVVFRRLLLRETNASSWRELVRVYRRLEARGEIRGGRFVTGASGEQFALPSAVERLREIRRSSPGDRVIVISGADPLNLVGTLTSGERIRALTSTRIAFRRGVPVAVREGDYVRPLADLDAPSAAAVATALAGRPRRAIVSGRLT